jgi:hypothetical protein
MSDAAAIVLVITVISLIVLAHATANALTLLRVIHRLEKKLDALAERVKEERK